MNKIFIFLGILAVLFGCSTIDVATSQKTNITKEMNKIVVFSFDIKGADWGDEFSDAVAHHLFKTGKMEVVDRLGFAYCEKRAWGCMGLEAQGKVYRLFRTNLG